MTGGTRGEYIPEGYRSTQPLLPSNATPQPSDPHPRHRSAYPPGSGRPGSRPRRIRSNSLLSSLPISCFSLPVESVAAGGGYSVAAGMMSGGKGKMMGLEDEDGGVDELLAALGYKVRASDMADVAQKLEQLDMAMSSSAAQDDAFVSHLASDTVHYNPSDLSTWLESMLSELNAPPPPLPLAPIPNHRSNQFEPPLPPAAAAIPAPILDPAECFTVDFPTPRLQSEYDLKPIPAAPGRIVYGSEPQAEENARDRKRMKTSSSSSSSS